MTIRSLFPDYPAGRAGLGLLALRLVVGAAFLFHGWPKIQNPFGWMGPQAPVPGALQLLAALSEFGGGLALILGLLTPLAAIGIAGNMVVALGMVHIPQGLLSWVSPASRPPSWLPSTSPTSSCSC